MTMRTYLLALGIVALAVPAAALADDPGQSEKSPAQMCAAERTAMTAQNFKTAYGTNKNKSNAFGKCVSKKTNETQENRASAAKLCKAEQGDPNFAASHDGKTFEQAYGTSKNGSNAFGKCVSKQARVATEEHHEEIVNAAKACKSMRKNDAAGFAGTFGTKKNAFGKCVSKHAHGE
jgi:hypothetical protein